MEWVVNKERNNKIREMRKQGCSIKEIARTLHYAQSSVSNCCKSVKCVVPKTKLEKTKAQCRLNAEKASLVNKQKWSDERATVILEAETEWPQFKQNPELLGFLAAYWAEGSKRSKAISIINNDPGIILLAMKIFDKLSLNKSRSIIVRCYPEQNKEDCRKFWESLLKTKVKIKDKSWLGKKRKIHSQFGLCSVTFNDYKLFWRLITWIHLWRNELAGGTLINKLLWELEI